MRNENEEMKNGLRRVAMAVALGVLLVLAGCSSEELGSSEKPAGTEAGGNTIVLGVKEVRSAVTRSQHTGSMDFTQLKSTGFGVYGYQGAYNSSTSKPTLFATGANTKVTFETGGTDPTTALVHPGSWKYAETAANQKEWVTTDKYTFFAYAPYMSAGEGTRGTDAGINTISTGNGDPTIGYTVATNPAQSVDLLWGVRTDSEAKSGLPWVDCMQTETASTVLFTFCHALCAVGFHAQVMADQANDTDNLGDVSQLGTIGDADGCKVTLRSITLTPAGIPAKNEDPAVDPVHFYQSAVLNLNNDTKFKPKWSAHSGTIASLTLDNGEIDTKLLDPNTSDFEDANPMNYDVMTSESYDTEVPGITETANSQAVIAGDNVFMLIPQVAQDYTVSIKYFITYKTASGYHREAKTGTATLRNIELVAGVKYYFNLVFGLTTFKVSVDAVDWNESTSSVTIATETGTSASNSLAREMRSED